MDSRPDTDRQESRVSDPVLGDLLASAAASLAAAATHVTPDTRSDDVADPLTRILGWIATHPDPVDQARLLGALVDRRNATRLATARADTLRAAVQASSRTVVAARLGITPKALTNIISLHATKGRPQ